jgi:hypothetical protein
MTDSRPGAWDSANTIAHFEQYGVETLNWSEHPEAFLMIAGIFVAGRVHA